MRKQIARWLAATGLALGVAYAITLGATPSTTFADGNRPPTPTATSSNPDGNNPGGSGSGTGGG